jgi:hypothetical protein
MSRGFDTADFSYSLYNPKTGKHEIITSRDKDVDFTKKNKIPIEDLCKLPETRPCN